MHIYAFGSVCRGEIDRGSDIDLLACIDRSAPQIDTEKYSVYQYERLKDLWNEGNPFAWHLHLESKLLFSPDGSDFLKGLGVPSSYRAIRDDLEKFKSLFDRSFQALGELTNSATFHLSCIFLAIRNYATCYSLSTGSPIFSRRSPLMVTPNLDIDPEAFSVLVRARLLSTRGYGEGILDSEVAATYRAVATVPQWMEALRSQQLND
jgi:hypothetical protein